MLQGGWCSTGRFTNARSHEKKKIEMVNIVIIFPYKRKNCCFFLFFLSKQTLPMSFEIYKIFYKTIFIMKVCFTSSLTLTSLSTSDGGVLTKHFLKKYGTSASWLYDYSIFVLHVQSILVLCCWLKCPRDSDSVIWYFPMLRFCIASTRITNNDGSF